MYVYIYIYIYTDIVTSKYIDHPWCWILENIQEQMDTDTQTHRLVSSFRLTAHVPGRAWLVTSPRCHKKKKTCFQKK